MNTLKDNFSDCNEGAAIVYNQENVPVFQHKVYTTEADAKQAVTGEVQLVQSNTSGFIFNKKFNPSLLEYDEKYQNEQANSKVFQDHLQDVLSKLKSFGIQNKKVVEIGCGKGVFFEMMLKEGIDCWGFDPTYEGNNARIVKEYFTEKYNDINADVIILRHTLEHIPNPFSFIHTIAKANNYKGYLFAEIPCFDWIVKKESFWDIFYEHCNYFTQQSLSAMFEDATTGSFFGDQYIYIWADLSKLRSTIPAGQAFTKRNNLVFNDKIDFYKKFLKEHPSLAIWGAGAKGSTFLNLLDKDKQYVKYVIDINPAKQNLYIAGTGHKIYSPEILQQDPLENILIMNEIYFNEIKETTSFLPNVHLFNL